ncbi:G-protein coupled receptor 22-like [Megalops cyprinoides]|uniref:G-protein coupled receptor 22-like n=1 Tax=Megalops cyprinoides TaxID=118141 RepID=UPI001864C604|nr:G-protein coupled receptor 22-like [Megalops cyprinoides]
MHILPSLDEAATMSNVTVQDVMEPASDGPPAAPFPVSYQVPLTCFLVLEIVLGLSSNLTVLALYCMKSDLIGSVSNVVTVNLHVLDAAVCVCCAPLTAAVVLLPAGADAALLCCFHEACVSFASVATAANVLAITLDRYDISVRPANRVLTMGRAAALLGAVWAVSFFSFLVPFVEAGFFGQGGLDRNRTAEPPEDGDDRYDRYDRYDRELELYYHLLAQIPIFLFTAVVMLVTYAKILQALNIRIGARFQAARRKKAVSTATQPEAPEAAQGDSGGGAEAGAGPGAATGGRSTTLGMRASVSVIIALRRAVKRHRERRERQRRVFRMSLLIVSTFLLCWTPITALNAAILATGPGRLTLRLRPAFLVMAYGTTVFHPLLYAFTRQKFQKVLRSTMKKRVVSIVEADPLPNNTVIHNSWIDPKRNKKVTFEESELRQKCLSSEEVV